MHVYVYVCFSVVLAVVIEKIKALKNNINCAQISAAESTVKDD